MIVSYIMRDIFYEVCIGQTDGSLRVVRRPDYICHLYIKLPHRARAIC